MNRIRWERLLLIGGIILMVSIFYLGKLFFEAQDVVKALKIGFVLTWVMGILPSRGK